MHRILCFQAGVSFGRGCRVVGPGLLLINIGICLISKQTGQFQSKLFYMYITTNKTNKHVFLSVNS